MNQDDDENQEMIQVPEWTKSVSSPGGILRVIIVQVISYIKFTQITPAILMYAGMFGALTIFGQETIGSRITVPPLVLFSFLLGLDPTKPHSFGIPEVVRLYLIISFILYIFMSILRFFVNFELNISIRRKIIIATIIPIIFYFLFFTWILFASRNTLSKEHGVWILTCVLLSLFTIAAGIYAILVSKVSDFIIGVLNGDQKEVKEYIKIANPTDSTKT